MPDARTASPRLALPRSRLSLPGRRAQAADCKVVATFSILADLVRQVGGDRVEVGPWSARTAMLTSTQPTPADATARGRMPSSIVVNGLKFEGWIDRLVKASGTQGARSSRRRPACSRRGRRAAGETAMRHGGLDPHAWQDVANAKLYVANIRDALVAADPAGKEAYEANAAAYLARLDALDADVRARDRPYSPPSGAGSSPRTMRSAISQRAYGLDFIAPQGVSTEAEASARDVARIIQQIRAEKIPAVFLENVSDPRLIQRIASETGAKIGERLYSDALSPPDGPAATYIDMMRHNIRAFSAALSS